MLTGTTFKRTWALGGYRRPLAITKWYFLLTTGIDSRRIILIGRTTVFLIVKSILTELAPSLLVLMHSCSSTTAYNVVIFRLPCSYQVVW